MNDNLDFLYNQLLSWLQQKDDDDLSPSVNGVSAADNANDAPVWDWELEQIESLAGDEKQATELPQKIDMGDKQTVKNRFQALLKRKLKAEIENHPPLFPWETEYSSYEAETADTAMNNLVPFRRLWIPQLRRLESQIQMPKKILAQLLDACSEAMQSRRPDGAKMVRAVSSLFPDQSQYLNQMAGMVLLGPARNPELELPPKSFEQATTQQKMALSLIAAKEIINNLTLTLSGNQPYVERQWQTAAGLVTVHAEYKPPKRDSSGHPKAAIRVNVRLPKGGSVTLQTPQESAQAERTYPGHLCVELFDWQPGQIYSLEIRLFDPDQTPLNFALAIEE